MDEIEFVDEQPVREPHQIVTSTPPAPVAPTTSPWVWVSLAMSTIAFLATVGVGIVAILAFTSFAALDGLDDEFGGEEPGYYVDQGSVIDAVEEPCEDMLEAAEDVAVGGSTGAAASALRAWTAAAQRIVAAVNAAEPNQDSREWRDDWSAIIKAVEAYADNFGEANNTLTLPEGLEDMYWETDAECGVPVVIAGLDTKWAGYMLGE